MIHSQTQKYYWSSNNRALHRQTHLWWWRSSRPWLRFLCIWIFWRESVWGRCILPGPHRPAAAGETWFKTVWSTRESLTDWGAELSLLSTWWDSLVGPVPPAWGGQVSHLFGRSDRSCWHPSLISTDVQLKLPLLFDFSPTDLTWTPERGWNWASCQNLQNKTPVDECLNVGKREKFYRTKIQS